MKKIILLFLLVASTTMMFAQAPCSPSGQTASSAGYILPDSATNFNHACIGQPYVQYVYIKAPKDTTIVFNGVSVPASVDSFVVEKTVTGLPTGLIVEANPNYLPPVSSNPKANFERMVIKGDSLACIKISGTIPSTATPGIATLNINVRAYLTISGIIQFDSLSTVDYYHIELKAAPCFPAAVNDLASSSIYALQCLPNPAQNTVSIQFDALKTESMTFALKNLLGQVVYSQAIKVNQGLNKHTFNIANFPNGVYMYQLSNEDQHTSGKLQIAH
ncbi:MAG: T9SS type A sorting domain-containing protein [Chitinophagaceae bacterium]